MILYVNGCSHTWGSVVKCHESYAHIFMESVVGKNYKVLDINPKEINSGDTFQLLSKIDNNNHYLIKAASNGKGNAMIYQETLWHLLMMEKYNIKIDYIITQFSGQSRNFYVLPEGNLHHITAHDEPEKGLLFNPIGGFQSLILMYSLQEILKSKNYKFLIMPYHDIQSSERTEQFDKDCFDLNYFTCHPLEGHRFDFLKRGLAGDSPGHADYFGHWFLANICLEKLGLEDFEIGFFDFFKDYTRRKLTHQNLPTKKFNKKHLRELTDEGDNASLEKIKNS
tara:strand:+ start:1360 stop:2202 length:843 start_codon:yes stop_codon:yes gene_type:complete